MKNLTLTKIVLMLTFIIAMTIKVSEARGGRRGGGSLGGIFGGFRKYKKPTSTGSSRRSTINGSPMHTALTKSTSTISKPSSISGNAKKFATYPKQQMAGYANNGFGPSYYQHLPPGGQYYTNTGAIPNGAYYYPHPPPAGSSLGSNSDFLYGLMAGHIVSRTLHGHGTYVRHVYHKDSQQNVTDGNDKIIIINNGENGGAETGSSANVASTQEGLWPTDSIVPPAPYTTSETPNSAQLSMEQESEQGSSDESDSDSSKEQQKIPPHTGGIICVPFFFNETDPNDSSNVVFVEKIICYPAPAMPPQPEYCDEQTITTASDNNDPTILNATPNPNCIPRTTTEIIPVAGDIGENIETTTPKPQLETNNQVNETELVMSLP